MLKYGELLTYNLGLLKWVWNEQVIEQMTMSTDNVVDLLQGRMKKMSPQLQLLLLHNTVSRDASCQIKTFHRGLADNAIQEAQTPKVSQSSHSNTAKMDEGWLSQLCQAFLYNVECGAGSLGQEVQTCRNTVQESYRHGRKTWAIV